MSPANHLRVLQKGAFQIRGKESSNRPQIMKRMAEYSGANDQHTVNIVAFPAHACCWGAFHFGGKWQHFSRQQHEKQRDTVFFVSFVASWFQSF